jgi:phage terminase large subunit-like protein
VPTLAALADRFSKQAHERIRPPYLKYIGEWRTADCYSSDPAKRPTPAMAPNWLGLDQPCRIHGDPCRKCHACAACRPEQRVPDGDHWNDYLLLGGRGLGKTRACAEEVAAVLVLNRRWRVAILAPTYADARDTCVEGESGLLAIFERWGLVEGRDYTWNRSIGELIMTTTRSRAKLYSGEKPARLRGPQHHMAWVEELAQVVRVASDAVDMLRFGLRLGKHPRLVASTTPLPLQIIRDMIADPKCAVGRGQTDDNAANLPPVTLEALHRKYDGTRLGRQELAGDLLDDMPGALWRRAWLDDGRVQVGTSANWADTNPDTMQRSAAEAREAARAIVAELEDRGIVLHSVVVGVDPAVTSTEDADESGIIVTGRAGDGHFYVLADYTVRETPDVVVTKIIQAYDDWEANAVIVEVNNGGEWIPNSIHAARRNTGGPTMTIESIRAKKGKRVRAEPASAVYEQGRAHHVGEHKHLEDVLCVWTTDQKESPDRMDAVVYTVLWLDGHGAGSNLLTTTSTIARHQFGSGRTQMSTSSTFSRR